MRNKLLILLIFLLLFTIGAVLLFVYKEYPFAIIATVVSIILFITTIKQFRNSVDKLNYLLNSIENDDFAFRFSNDAERSFKEELHFSYTLNRLKDIMANEKSLAREQEKYFELMLDNVITGIITISERGDVIFCNNKTYEMFGLSVLTHIDQLNRVSEELAKKMAEITPDEKPTISFYTESGEVFLSLKCNYVTIRDKKLKIVAINDIGQELEEKELESWTRLIRVLTHEIMNTVTPISSLSETLSKNYGDTNEEIKQGLEVISSTSRGLISFVDSYRKLTRIPEPIKIVVPVKSLLNKLITLNNDDIENLNIDIIINMKDENIMIYVDENLILQVLINLIKNSFSALKEIEGKRFITFNINVDNNEDVIIDIVNNGLPISKELQEQIFIPFFTTKNTGTGIGLSISRQIMKLHNGTLKLKTSNEKETVFTLIFR
ncbi:GHKL domain-containing protein [Bacteroidales bacterium OttesenSCG-928-K03]|nr:GHKL domain-containing protein [Odoribacter sp. OttesenSCG-928-L07]MDL2239808.1 GHKL domain-containing protein [Bacteroidales bacterium OttesenSCG-928-L14]MDL2241147.1 GHKL domain-containing protein [Bacteroidales bacterium OttesenSCG-928-K22]MDL2243030.1 GHKL domain-containing protein [Bacteroidales bacterium OttesenSCG-928-K03]